MPPLPCRAICRERMLFCESEVWLPKVFATGRFWREAAVRRN
jgi:hypothetical protein